MQSGLLLLRKRKEKDDITPQSIFLSILVYAQGGIPYLAILVIVPHYGVYIRRRARNAFLIPFPIHPARYKLPQG
jgi:hypothetical protein